jgi:hypothetical protein
VSRGGVRSFRHHHEIAVYCEGERGARGKITLQAAPEGNLDQALRIRREEQLLVFDRLGESALVLPSWT